MVVFFPAGTRDERPSSHLRVYEIESELESRGFRCLVVDSRYREDVKRCFLDEAPDGTVLYIQKMDAKQLKAGHFDSHIERCTIVYDVDDHDTSSDHLDMFRLADAVVAGSTFVEEEAKAHSSNVRLIHSLTDTDVYSFVDRSHKPDDMPVRIVWCEHWANEFCKDLMEVAPALRRLHADYGIELLLQGFRDDDHPDLESRPVLKGKIDMVLEEMPFAEIVHVMPVDEYINKGVKQLKGGDIGIIPFLEDRVGKAAQNLRSLMSMGLACVASPGNDQEHVIRDGETGFLAKRTGNYADTWFELIKMLILDRDRRLEMGRRASDDIQGRFSRKVTVDKVANLLEAMGEKPERVSE